MDAALITQLKILKMTGSKPNFSELARMYDIDRRTVKKYYDGYSGKPAHHNKSSRLDDYEVLIRNKLAIKGTTAKAVYEFLFAPPGCMRLCFVFYWLLLCAVRIPTE